MLRDLVVSVAHLIGKPVAHPVLHAGGQLDAGRYQLIALLLHNVVQLFSLFDCGLHGAVQLGHEECLSFENFCGSRAGRERAHIDLAAAHRAGASLNSRHIHFRMFSCASPGKHFVGRMELHRLCVAPETGNSCTSGAFLWDNGF
jgi:hypothetical protein